MAAGLFNRSFKNKIMEEFVADLSSANSKYYICFGKSSAWDDGFDGLYFDDNTPPAANASLTTSYYDVYKDLLYGKIVDPTDFNYLARKITWTSNTVYSYFDSTDADLYNKDFYAVNQYGSVYKCLFNNYGAKSTVEPTSILPNIDFNTQPDNYKWKYLFTINYAKNQKFTTSSYIPIVPDSQVLYYSESGAIHTIVVDNPGSGYISANGFISSIVDNYTVRLDSIGPSSVSGSYNLSTMNIIAGSGIDDSYTISNYVVNTSGKYVTSSTPLNYLDTTSYFYIAPTVTVTGDGSSSRYNGQILAYPIVNTFNGSISSINVIDRGGNFTYGTVDISANVLYGSGATAHAIISPPGGHGSDVVSELGCDTLGLSVDITLQDDLPDWTDYRQISLLYNPISSDTNQLYSNTSFIQITQLATAYFAGLIPKGNKIRGFSSGATAEVLYMNSTTIYITNPVGRFIDYETIVDDTTGTSTIITIINNYDLVPNTGEIFYYKNMSPVTRSGATLERVQLYFKI